jgi:hypothetical protein
MKLIFSILDTDSKIVQAREFREWHWDDGIVEVTSIKDFLETIELFNQAGWEVCFAEHYYDFTNDSLAG